MESISINVLRVGTWETSFFLKKKLLSDEGPTIETINFTFNIWFTPNVFYFDTTSIFVTVFVLSHCVYFCYLFGSLGQKDWRNFPIVYNLNIGQARGSNIDSWANKHDRERLFGVKKKLKSLTRSIHTMVGSLELQDWRCCQSRTASLDFYCLKSQWKWRVNMSCQGHVNYLKRQWDAKIVYLNFDFI